MPPYPFWRAWEYVADPDAGREAYERALRILEYTEDFLPAPDERILALRGFACVRLGRYEEGLEWIERGEALGSFGNVPFPTGFASAAIFQALAEGHLGRLDEARATLRTALEVEARLGELQRSLLAEARALLGSE